ncbi:MAG: helix-turn-helix domain-containing protein [Nitrosospira sp.]|nr:helix-turn-helix domain-containing protein [Nitrosospira sp.]
MSSLASEQQKQLDSTALTSAKEQAGAAGISLKDPLEHLIRNRTCHELGATSETSPALLQISNFTTRVDLAAVLLSTAFVEDAVMDFEPWKKQRTTRKRHGPACWYRDVVNHGIERAHEVGKALVHRWNPTARAERLAVDAFMLLTELTPSRGELVRICQYDRPKAFYEMSKALEAITQQIEHSSKLIAEVEVGDEPQLTEGKRFAELKVMLLEKADGGLSLTQAAELLGVSRQAVHKRVKARTILGMMDGAELVLPRAQFMETDGRVEVLPGIAEVLKHFKVAGDWSALQFLVEPDPNLADVPLHALVEGRIGDVCHAAKAYLDIDED